MAKTKFLDKMKWLFLMNRAMIKGNTPVAVVYKDGDGVLVSENTETYNFLDAYARQLFERFDREGGTKK